MPQRRTYVGRQGRVAVLLSALLWPGLALTIAAGPAVAATPAPDAPDAPDAAAPRGPATGSAPAAERALAERFAPMVYLVRHDEPCGVGEPFQPSSVDPLLDNTSVALRGPWTRQDLVQVGPAATDLDKPLPGYSLDLPGNPLQPGCDYEKLADQLWAGSPPTVYAHVATQADRPGRLALQYWFFYPYNDFNNKHEGDWERIQLEFDANTAAQALQRTPTDTIYSAHEGAERSSWDEDPLEIVDGTHPAVYVSAGSHASRYSSGLFLLRSSSQGLGCDATLDPAPGVLPVVETIPSDPAQARAEFPWTTFQGRWGEQSSLAFYSGPTGPSTKQQWRQPFNWSDRAEETSYQVPGGQVYGVKTTDFFCSAVGNGSVLLLRYSDDPGLTLVVLALLVAAVVWLVRRTSWGDSAPFPARQRRDLGQTASAAWETYRRHPWLFLGIGSVVAVVSLVIGGLQQLVADAPTGSTSTTSSLLEALLNVVGTVVLTLTAFVSASATVRALAELDAGRPVTARGAYRLALGRAGALVVTLLAALAVMVPMALSIYLVLGSPGTELEFAL